MPVPSLSPQSNHPSFPSPLSVSLSLCNFPIPLVPILFPLISLSFCPHPHFIAMILSSPLCLSPPSPLTCVLWVISGYFCTLILCYCILDPLLSLLVHLFSSIFFPFFIFSFLLKSCYSIPHSSLYVFILKIALISFFPFHFILLFCVPLFLTFILYISGFSMFTPLLFFFFSFCSPSLPSPPHSSLVPLSTLPSSTPLGLLQSSTIAYFNFLSLPHLSNFWYIEDCYFSLTSQPFFLPSVTLMHLSSTPSLLSFFLSVTLMHFSSTPSLPSTF